MADEIDISRADLNREEQIALLRSSVARWNAWRRSHPEIRPNLSGADLLRMDLAGALLSGALLSTALLRGADLLEADLSGADLTGAFLYEANLYRARLSGADLTGANLFRADLYETDLYRTDLTGANLSGATLIDTSLVNATLDGCWVYGISAWNVRLDGATQTNLRITPDSEPAITVDDLRVAQFLYLLLNNQEIRAVIDTLTSKVVLLLGRFSDERKPVLEALRDALRQHGYVPVLFDFAGPESRNVTETMTLLARMARFIIADLTDPGSIPYELAKLVPDVHVPIQPLLLAGTSTFAIGGDMWMAREMLPVYRFTTPRELLAALAEKVIEPAEAKVKEIEYIRATAITRSGLP